MPTPKRTVTEEIQERRSDLQREAAWDYDVATLDQEASEKACQRSGGHTPGGLCGTCAKCGGEL